MTDTPLSWTILWRRLKGEMPSFFKKLRLILVAQGTILGLVETWLSDHPTIHLPHAVDVVMGYMAVCSLFGAILVSLTVKTPVDTTS